MHVKVTLKNYRCFSETFPANFEVGPGFTAFIGPNNSGKSTLLKLFYEARPALAALAMVSSGSNSDYYITGSPFPGGVSSPATDPLELVYESASGSLVLELRIPPAPDEHQPILTTAWLTFLPETAAWTITLVSADGRPFVKNKPDPNTSGINGERLALMDGNYLDLRPMAEAAKALADVQYIGPFRNAVNEGAGNYFDLTLGTGFVAQWHAWKAGAKKRENQAIGRVTEDVRRLLDVRTLEINAAVELKTLQLVINGRPHKLSEIGAGVAQLIVTLGNALIRRPRFIAIDEPETHLHPALQFDFLTTLASYATDGVLFATHSIGLARSTADRLYSVQAGERGSIVRAYEKTFRYAEFLGSLGIAGLQEIGWNTILLVEGTHDVRTFQQWLRKYGMERKVVVLPMGGSSMINGGTTEQLQEVVRLSGGAVAAVIDSECASPSEIPSRERLAFESNCKALGFECLITKKRATENYLTQQALEATYKGRYSALGDYGVSGGQVPFWGKSENWRVAANMTKEELDDTDIGKFLMKLRG